MIKAKRSALALTVILAIGCGTRLASPPQLSPIGDIAYYAHRVIQAVDTLQNVAIEGEKAGAISTDDAKKIVAATKISAQAGVQLANALKAGLSETEAKKQAIAVIKNALENLPDQLSEKTANLVRPYIQTVLVLLTVFS